MSDLVHFAILFFGVTIGYSIAGVLLFGHQYEGFSTFQKALVYMVVVLISWDPYQWIQVVQILTNDMPLLFTMLLISFEKPKSVESCCSRLDLQFLSLELVFFVLLYSGSHDYPGDTLMILCSDLDLKISPLL